MKNAAMVPAIPIIAYVDWLESVRVGRAVARAGMDEDRMVAVKISPNFFITVLNRDPRAVPVKSACAKGPPTGSKVNGERERKRVRMRER